MQLLLLFLLIHPYHVSVSEIHYDDETKAIQITERIFVDDLEEALRKSIGDPLFVVMDDSLKTHQYIQSYFLSNFKFKVNGQVTSYNYLGGEMDNDVIWCYLEITDMKQPESIQLTNTLLTETYDDQKNLVHFKINGEKKSYILNDREIIAEYHK